MVLRNETSRGHDVVFGIRAVVAPADRAMPGHMTRRSTRGRFAVYESSPEGYFGVVDVAAHYVGPPSTGSEASERWLTSALPPEGLVISLDPRVEVGPPLQRWEALPNPTAADANLVGRVISETKTGEDYQGRIEVNRPSLCVHQDHVEPRSGRDRGRSARSGDPRHTRVRRRACPCWSARRVGGLPPRSAEAASVPLQRRGIRIGVARARRISSAETRGVCSGARRSGCPSGRKARGRRRCGARGGLDRGASSALSRKAHRRARRDGVSASHRGDRQGHTGRPRSDDLGPGPQLWSRTAALRILAAVSVLDRAAVSRRGRWPDERDPVERCSPVLLRRRRGLRHRSPAARIGVGIAWRCHRLAVRSVPLARPLRSRRILGGRGDCRGAARSPGIVERDRAPGAFTDRDRCGGGGADPVVAQRCGAPACAGIWPHRSRVWSRGVPIGARTASPAASGAAHGSGGRAHWWNRTHDLLLVAVSRGDLLPAHLTAGRGNVRLGRTPRVSRTVAVARLGIWILGAGTGRWDVVRIGPSSPRYWAWRAWRSRGAARHAGSERSDSPAACWPSRGRS